MSSNRFGGLAANVTTPHRVVLLSPITGDPIKDKKGKEAFIEILASDSPEGRAFDKQRRAKFTKSVMQSPTGQPADDGDEFEANAEKLAVLTKGWHLVDPVTKEVIDVAFSKEAATEVYSAPGTGWLYRQVFAAAYNTANFMRRSSKI